MKVYWSLVLAIASGLNISSPAQAPNDWRDLPDHMTGNWSMTGRVVGQNAHHSIHAEWVLNRQFLRIEENTAQSAPPSERRYNAVWFLAYDEVSERYVIHLLDGYGARFSETLGYGTRRGNDIQFVFEYPDGPFHTTLRWSPDSEKWEWLMEQKNKDGKWSQFADLNMTRQKGPS